MAGSWTYSFAARDRTGERLKATAMTAPEEGQRPCARGEFCTGRRVTVENGEHAVTPAWTWRSYCDRCEAHIAACIAEFPRLYGSLHAAIGDPAQSRTRVHMPPGPRTPLREDIEAHMRVMETLLATWAGRVRTVARLSRPDPDARISTPRAVADAARILAAHCTALLLLQPAWMQRTYPYPLPPDRAEVLADAEIVRVGEGYVVLMTQASGEDAGRDVQYLHYKARSLLLETIPPPEILVMPCRECTMRTLRRAWPDGDRDVWSRCVSCGDEMTQEEYEVSAKRWASYYRAQQPAKLAATPVADVA